MSIDEMLDFGMEQAAADEILTMESQHHVRLLKECMDSFNDSRILFNLIVDVYVSSGYNFPRQIIQKAKALSKAIPEDERLAGLPDGDVITVYRSSITTDESALRCEPSWTINRETAVWFALHSAWKDECSPLKLYSAEIARSEIIAYTNQRHEHEIIQYRSVKNIKALPDPTEEEIQIAMLFKAGINKENEWFDDPEDFDK